ncbi:FkbM family methyltransferase [Halorussus salinisoli]|uniref:FkbM family methyltransferase n=1 Tax=Halorussus salinisoli TaxID=2558242 RepID=UPI0010C214E9|nr:FkbM family methyltransferase [Halorussus salinisoli]
MTDFHRCLLGARNLILQYKTITQAIEVPISVYRRGLYYFGPDKKEIRAGDGISAQFYTETSEEIRHFYPIYGELDNLNQFVSDLEPDDIVYDIGAHVGIYSCIAAAALNDSQIFAFEPHPENVDRLNENAALNGYNLQVYQCALSSNGGKRKFGIDNNKAGAVGHSDASVRNDEIKVQFIRGSDLVENQGLPLPNVIKIDIEGAELDALYSLDGVLKECRLVYCEISDQLERYGNCKDELVNFFLDRGFEVESLGIGGSSHENIRAVR